MLARIYFRTWVSLPAAIRVSFSAPRKRFLFLSTRIKTGYADWDEGNLSRFLVAAQNTIRLALQNGYHPGNAIIDHAGRFSGITSEFSTIHELTGRLGVIES
jgi:hypothetical protein